MSYRITNNLLFHQPHHILLKLLPALNATGKKRAIQKKNNISLRHSIQSVLWEVGGTLSCEIECNTAHCLLAALMDIALLDLLAEEKQGSQNV